MQKIIPLFLIMFLGIQSVSAQDNNKDTWYVWIDTETTIDGKSERFVSEEILEITCCVKSPKFRRFNQKASKWLKQEYNAIADTPFKKIQDKKLAEQMISEAKNEPSVRIVQYDESCK